MVEAAGKVGRQGERDRLLLTLIYRHGLRVSEAVDLRWSDFDLEAPKARTLHVRRLKGSKDSIHTLEPDTARLLKRMERESDGQYVFRSERGGPMSVDAVQVVCARAGREAGLKFKVHPHQLRHACGFFWRSEGRTPGSYRTISATRTSRTPSFTPRPANAGWPACGCDDWDAPTALCRRPTARLPAP